jgi:hypothetical protein
LEEVVEDIVHMYHNFHNRENRYQNTNDNNHIHHKYIEVLDANKKKTFSFFKNNAFKFKKMLEHLKHVTELINQQKNEEAYTYWKETIPDFTLSLKHYDTTHTLLDTKWISLCESLKKSEESHFALERLTIHQGIKYQHCNTFVGKLEPLIRVLPSLRILELPAQPIRFFGATNPFIIPNKETNGFIINVRHVNYHCDEKNQYHCNDPKETIVHTKNILYFMDKELSLPPKKVIELVDRTEFCAFPSPVQDLEDVRLVYREQGRLWCTATSRECMASTMPQIVLSEVNYIDKSIRYGLRLLSHEPEAVNNVQKNWLPFTHPTTGQLLMLYSTGPTFVIEEVDELTGQCNPKVSIPTPCSFQQGRGGSPPILFTIPGTSVAWMYTVHYAYDQPNIRRKYFHRCVFLDQALEPLFITESFTFFKEHAIEFVLSACEADDQSIYFGVGKNDVNAFIIQVRKETLWDLKRFGLN